MNEIRIIGLDLDGTLLRRDHSVSEKNKQMLQECIKRNILVYLVSGRPYCFTRMIAQQIHPDVKTISSNGAIYEIGNQCIEKTLTEEALHRIIGVLKRQKDAHAFFKGKQEFFTHESYDKRFLYDHMREQLPVDAQVKSYTELDWQMLKQKVHDIDKILVYDLDINRLIETRTQIECIENTTVTDYQKVSFDITAGGVTKGNAIKAVLSHYNLKKEALMAFGDANNDLSMFDEAGLTVAMGNASEQIRTYCDIVTADFMEDGVAKAIQRYVLE